MTACSGQIGMPISLLPPAAAFLFLFDIGSVCFCLTSIIICRAMRPISIVGINMTCIKKNRGTVPVEGKLPANNRLEIQSPIHGTDFAM
ncbi:hypothetical protein BMS3Bbin07_00157 [bacterium BMS3Bbin07]|nr:hypothetical protein BMS3Bbin07_00157 [bacterium BMS3Bbin07]